MEPQNSILDRVLSSKKTTEIEQFNPTEVASSLLKNLTSREEDVLRRRHGLLGREEETLEEIGKTYQVTRERVRQIENTAIDKIKKLKDFQEILAPIESTVFSVLEHRGGVMAEESLLRELLQVTGETTLNRKNILFIIGCLLQNKFRAVRASGEFRQSWRLLHAPMHLLQEALAQLMAVIQNSNKPLLVDEIIEALKKTEFYQKNQEFLTDDVIASYLEISPAISKNPFGEYGLSAWGSILPKRMNDKIYLVLKKEGKPLHFTEITQKINEIKFDDRQAYPPTVHNELILNSQYVLVGRGIYALKEWGYKPGVVASVLVDIFKKENRPMTRDELVKRVLEQRMVKKNTIHLALTDRAKFKRHPDNTYTLAEQAP